jgi:monofunctional biosynthetic peptidoglycan transglycosylase
VNVLTWIKSLNPRRRPKKAIGVGLFLLAVGFILWACWPVPMASLVEHNPEKTCMMEIRAQQAARKHLPYALKYRWVNYKQVSEHLRKAVVAAEDDTFYEHHGVDYPMIWISIKQCWKHRAFVQGGSTITQQVTKNLYLSPRKNPLRKIREAVLAQRLERYLSKRRILEIYLNIAEWGRGIFGAEAAARYYFKKPAADLTLDEAVALVAVLPSPLKHSPLKEDRFLKWRKAWVLRQMRYKGYLPKAVTPLEAEPEPDWIADEEDDAGEEDAVPDSRANTPGSQNLQMQSTPGPEAGEPTQMDTDETPGENEDRPGLVPTAEESQ